MDLASTHTGEGYPLLLLHGLFGSSGNWASVARDLGSTYTVFALDQRNHGRSPRAAVMSYDAMAEDVLSFMGRRGIARAHLLGHSMGGKTVMRLAQREPQRVSRLVVVDIAPGATEAGHEEIVEALRSVDLSRAATRDDVGRALEGEIPEARVRQFLLTNLRRDHEGRLQWKLNLDAIAANYASLVAPLPDDGRFDGPTLFLRGERSRHLRVEDEPVIRHAFPRASFLTVAGAGHWVHADAPEAFLAAVKQFLGQDGPRPKSEDAV